MDRPSALRGIRLATGAAIYRSRSGRHLWRRLHTAPSSDGHPGPADRRSPWQNGYAERLIGSIRRDCLDHVIVFGEQHLRHLLKSYQKYYNEARTHLSVNKDAPVARAVQAIGSI